MWNPEYQTLSRFENLATPAVLQKLIDFNIATGIERLKQKHGGTLPASITLDLDATDDPTHGHQQLTLFHGYFGQYQYFPLIISEPTTRHIFLAWLRPGTVHASLGADDDLMGGIRWQGVGPDASQRCRKKIEEVFGCLKTVAGLYRTRLVGRWKLKQQMQLAATAYNLLRIRKLAA